MILAVVQRIVHGLVVAAREVQRHAVREVPAVFQHERGEGVAGVHRRHERGGVGLSARVGLDIRELAPEELAGPLDGDRFDLVVKLAPAVVPRPRIPLGILVRQAGAHRVHDGGRDVVLAGDELQRVLLPIALFGDQIGDRGIGSADQVEHVGCDGVVGHGSGRIGAEGSPACLRRSSPRASIYRKNPPIAIRTRRSRDKQTVRAASNAMNSMTLVTRRAALSRR